MKRKSLAAILLSVAVMASVSSCTPAAVSAGAEIPSLNADELRIIGTSPAVVDILDKLEIELVGVPSSTISTIPERYKDVTVIGTAMAPDMELIKSLGPDWILSPVTLVSDLRPKYEAAKINSAFLNLRSVEGMYQSIQELGEMFDRRAQAKALTDEFNRFYEDYKLKNIGKKQPTVLVLMGLPGSYIIATENSYVGSLVKMAGGVNVYQDDNAEFLNVNTEDISNKDPDIILRAAHALPESVVEMFDEEFRTNDIWKHFRAVKENRVYDLNYQRFGMSAKFNYPEALADLQEIFYGEADVR